MSSNYAIVLEDTSTLREICGTNDQNLRVLEELFKCSIFTQGNQLILDDSDNQVQEDFSIIIEHLKSSINDGRVPESDFIKSIYNSVVKGKNGETEALKKAFINIPGFKKVFPRNYHQAKYIEGMDHHDIAFGIGPAGTGKTFLAVAHALGEIITKKKRRLVLTRPVVEAGESLGFLPGDLIQKINPYLRPLYDAMDYFLPGEVINKLQESRTIEIAPLAYMRGRSLRDAYIILDEAQNTTREQMKMFLTRIGEGSKAVITGDVTQIDLPSKGKSGLLHSAKILSQIDDIHFTRFTRKDVVRNPLVRKIIQAYENDEK